MNLWDFVISSPLLTLATLAGCGVIVYCSYTLFQKNLTGLSTLLGATTLVLFYLYSQAFAGSLREARTETIVVMPNKQNLRLGEDGNLSFCVNGMARTWEKTRNGIISTSPRYYLGRPMRCLSVEQGIALLRKNGATEEQLNAMRQAYEVN